MEEILSGKVILVTGGTGSIGSEIVKQALEGGASKVIAFSRNEIVHFMMKKRLADERFESVVGDVRNTRSLELVFRQFDIDIIFHAAAMKHVTICEQFPIEAVQTNILGTQNVVDLALRYGVPKMITVSTDKAASPVNVMGATKFIATRITLNANNACRGNQAFSCVRLGNVAGSRGSVIPVYVDNLLNGRPLELTEPGVTRFIMRITDAAKLIIRASQYARGGEVFILKMRAFRLGDLVDVMINDIAPRLNISSEEVDVTVKGLEMGEKLHEDLIDGTECCRTYEMDGMYVILPEGKANGHYPYLHKMSLFAYSSSQVELVSREELERIVATYLDGCMSKRHRSGNGELAQVGAEELAVGAGERGGP